MSVFITGGAGFVGSWLADHLREMGEVVHAPTRAECDVQDAAAVRRGISDAQPAVVFHLAAQSLPGRSWSDPAGTVRANVTGTIHILEAIRAESLPCVSVIAGSSSEYAASDKPLCETDPLDPSSPYAISKFAADQTARLYGERYGLRVIRVRPFFLIGPRKVGDVSSDLARRVVAVERGVERELTVGNTEAVRDFLDVRDGVRALRVIAERGTPGEVYNIASGRGVSIAGLIEVFQRQARREFVVRRDPALVRPLDEPVKIGDSAKLRKLGWEPRHSLEESVGMLLEYWRCR